MNKNVIYLKVYTTIDAIYPFFPVLEPVQPKWHLPTFNAQMQNHYGHDIVTCMRVGRGPLSICKDAQGYSCSVGEALLAKERTFKKGKKVGKADSIDPVALNVYSRMVLTSCLSYWAEVWMCHSFFCSQSFL